MKVLCAGELLIDMICTDKGKSLDRGEHFIKKAGGAPANVAAAIAALGGQTAIAARVGKDPFGKHLINTMSECGVDTRYIAEDSQHFTTMAFVSLMENGERDFVFSRGADGYLSSEDIASIPLEQFDVFHFGSATAFLPGELHDTYLTLLEKAKYSDKFISFDPNYRHLLFHDRQDVFRDNSLHFLSQCHFAKLSEEEALLISGRGTLDEAVIQLQRWSDAVLCITLGNKGTLLRVGDYTEIIGSIPVNPVDTTGAGDAFVGAVLYQLTMLPKDIITRLSRDQWKKIVFNANKAGARTCEYMGAMEAFRHLSNTIFNE
jgi:fructokinase